MTKETGKKHLVASFNNLAPELQDKIKELYPMGFADAMMRVDKPNGDFFYVVPFETEDVSYMVKIDVKVDDVSDEDDDKDYYDDDLKDAEEISDEAAGREDISDDDDM